VATKSVPGRDPGFIRSQLPFGRRILSYFSPEVRDVENIPATGPVLVVGNHSGLFYMPDAWLTGMAVNERRGIDAPTYSLSYDLMFAFPPLAAYLSRLGLVPASQETAEAALHDGAAVIVYPGGDHEACRPWKDAAHVDLAGHRGFVRLALRTGVPVVPVVAHGSHNSVIILASGERIAATVGLDRLRIKVFPIVVGPLGVPVPVLAAPPLPSSVIVRFLPALHWPSGEGADCDEALVDACYKEISEALQTGLDDLVRERPHPVVTGSMRLMGRLTGSASTPRAA